MKKIFFLLNRLSQFKAQRHCDKYLSEYGISMGINFPDNPSEFALIVPWNYQKVIKNYPYNNIIIFHSSDLPRGKGWAPIFNAFNEDLKQYVISAVLLNDHVDSGDIVAKAKFKIKNTYTAEFIREIDEEVVVMMTAEIVKKFNDIELTGVRQDSSKETYYKRRYPEENKVDLEDSLSDLVSKLKGCEKNHPVFFNYKGDDFIISIKPKIQPTFPEDLEIIF